MRMSGCQVSRRMKSPVVWYLLTSLLRVLHAGPPDPSPECSDGEVRLLTSFSDSDAISGALNGVLGDVRGTLEVCEDQLWKRVVLCVNGGGEQWTVENTAVACRDRGYTAPGESGAYNVQSESTKRLSYIPQCIGSEERLRDCSAVDQDDSCDAPLVISYWNSSEVTSSQPSHSLTLSSPAPFTSSLGNTPVFSSTALLSTNTAVPDTGKSSSDLHQPLPTSTPSLNSSSIDTSTSSPAPQPLIYLASAVGGVVALLTVSISAVLFYIACHQRRGRVRPTDGPYEVPITTAGSNPTFDTVPETEALYDRATTSVLHRQEEEEDREYHTLNYSLSHTKPSPPLSGHSTDSSTGPPPVYDTVASSGANPARDPPSQKPPVYYHVLQNPSGRAEEVKYHTLEEPPGHRYHVLEQTGETNTASGGCPMYSEVGQRRAATLQPHQHPPSSSNPNISPPRNLSRSTTLL